MQFLSAIILSASLLAASDFNMSDYRDRNQVYAIEEQAKKLLSQSRFDSSAILYDVAAMINLEFGDTVQYINLSLGTVHCLLKRGEIGSALLKLQHLDAMISEPRTKEYPERGLIFTFLAYVFMAREQYGLAEQNANKGISINLITYGNNHLRLSSSYYTMGLIKQALGEYDSALFYYNRAADIQLKSSDYYENNLGNIYLMIGSLYDEQSMYSSAIEYYNYALNNFDKRKSHSALSIASCYLNMLTCYINMNDYVKAIDFGILALDKYNALSLTDHADVASTYSKMSEIFIASGDVASAKDFLLRSLNIFSTKYPEKVSAIGRTYIQLGEVFAKMNNKKQAIEYALKGLELYKNVVGSSHPQLGFAYETVGSIYHITRQYSQAIFYFNNSIQIRKQLQLSTWRYDISNTYTLLARSFLESGNSKKSLECLNIALQYLDVSDKSSRYLQSNIHQRIGDVYFRNGQIDEAIVSYKSAAKYIDEISNDNIPSVSNDLILNVYLNELITISTQIAFSFEYKYKHTLNITYLDSSIFLYRDIMNSVDKVRRRYFSEQSKIILSENLKNIYRLACKTAVLLFEKTGNNYYKLFAFEAADRSKSNILLERIIDRRVLNHISIQDSLRVRDHRYRMLISQLHTAIEKYDNNLGINDYPSYSELMNKYFDTKQEYKKFTDELLWTHPQYRQNRHEDISRLISKYQIELKSSQIVIQYLFVGDSLYSFILTKKDLTVTIISGAKTMRSLIGAYVKSLKAYDTKAYLSYGQMLRNILYKPIETNVSLKSTKYIKFIPDEELYQLPFETLPIDTNKISTVNFSTINYLISRYEITYTYSLRYDHFAASNDTVVKKLKSFIGFAPVNPVNAQYSLSNAKHLVNDSTKRSELIVAISQQKRLSHSEYEVINIANILSKKGIAGSVYLHTHANEKNFKRNIANYDIIHLATHGMSNSFNPNLSFLLFSKSNQSETNEDGVFYLSEIEGIQLNADIVVLSSCESGVGKLVAGEGMIGLSRNLLFAGARNIVYSLWRVPDRQTAELMQLFYLNIIKSKGYTDALRSAKLKMIKNINTAFPGIWGGFVLIGQ